MPRPNCSPDALPSALSSSRNTPRPGLVARASLSLLFLGALLLQPTASAQHNEQGGWTPKDLDWTPTGDAVTWIEPDTTEGNEGVSNLVSVDNRGIKRWLLCFGGDEPQTSQPPEAAPQAEPEEVLPEPTESARVEPAPAPTGAQAPGSLYDLPTGDVDLSRGLMELTPPATEPANRVAVAPPATPQPQPQRAAASGPARSSIPLGGYRWTPRGDAVLVDHDGDLFTVRVADGLVTQLTHTPEVPESHVVFSPDGSAVAFGAAQHLWVAPLNGSGPARRLSPDAPDGVTQGELDWMTQEELMGDKDTPIAFSPDGKLLAYLSLDNRQVRRYPIHTGAMAPGEVELQYYPLPGEPLATPAVRVIDLAGNPVAGWELRGEGYIAPDLTFTPDSSGLAFMTLDRAQQTLTLRLLSTSGEVTTLNELTMPHWHNLLGGPVFLPDGKHYILMSPYFGHTQPFLGNINRPNQKLKRLLSVPWNLEIAGLDEKGDWLYLVGSGDISTERHLFKIKAKGGSFTRMTLRWGWHDVKVSPRGDAFVDTFSNEETLPETTLWRGRSKVADLHNAANTVDPFSQGSRKLVDLRAADDTKLYGQLWRPAQFDPARQYPVVVLVYGGPRVQTVTKQSNQPRQIKKLLDAGYLVWQLDNRGSSGRIHRFETAIDGQLGAVELEDQLVGVAYLKTLPYVDSSRLGIVGASYGGFMVLNAMTHSDVFKVGVSIAPVTDWARYDAAYTERYMGTPQENPEGYRRASVVESAANLRGDLLLVHAVGDENVHFENAVAFLAAAMAAGLDPEFMLLPTVGHGSSASSYMEFMLMGARTQAFLDAHLTP